MYALANSFLNLMIEYRVEVYEMNIYTHGAVVRIDLGIVGEDISKTMYRADYVIVRADGKETSGMCMNYPTKEATLVAVEKKAIEALESENHHWE